MLGNREAGPAQGWHAAPPRRVSLYYAPTVLGAQDPDMGPRRVEDTAPDKEAGIRDGNACAAGMSECGHGPACRHPAANLVMENILQVPCSPTETYQRENYSWEVHSLKS